jgi:hypothetical protein
MGLWLQYENRIHIRRGMAGHQERAIVVHEICHDIEAVTGVTMTEQDVTAFSSVLFGVIRDNPKLIAWLMEK